MKTSPEQPLQDASARVRGEGESGEGLASGSSSTGIALSVEDYSAAVGLALQVEDGSRPRALQAAAGIFGASDAGQCERRAVWTIQQRPHTDTPKLGNALSGTYLHAGILGALGALYPEWLIEPEMQCTLPSGAVITLHPDIIDPPEPSVTDLKTSKKWAAFEKTGPTDQQWMQVNLQYLAALQNGLITDDKGLTRLLYVNPADLDERVVKQAPFDMEWVHRADDWFQRVIHAVKEGEDGEQQWPINMCKDYCPFYTACRPPLAAADVPIPEGEWAELVRLLHLARASRKEWETVEKSVLADVKGLTGRVGDLRIVTTTVNGQYGPYQRVEVEEIGA